MKLKIKIHPNSSQEKVSKISEKDFEVWLILSLSTKCSYNKITKRKLRKNQLMEKQMLRCSKF